MYVYTPTITISDNVGHPTLGNLLANTVNYYQQFAPLVTSHSSKLTAVIDKEFNVRFLRFSLM